MLIIVSSTALQQRGSWVGSPAPAGLSVMSCFASVWDFSESITILKSVRLVHRGVGMLWRHYVGSVCFLWWICGFQPIESSVVGLWKDPLWPRGTLMRVWAPKPSLTAERSTEKATRGEEISAASTYAAVIKIKLLVLVGTGRCQEEKTLNCINITRPLVWCSSSPWHVERVVTQPTWTLFTWHHRSLQLSQIDGPSGVQGFHQSNMFFHTLAAECQHLNAACVAFQSCRTSQTDV